MTFIVKHLPDRFYQEGTQRIGLRGRIFREVVGNLLVHREFINSFPAKLIIEGDRVITGNNSTSNSIKDKAKNSGKKGNGKGNRVKK